MKHTPSLAALGLSALLLTSSAAWAQAPAPAADASVPGATGILEVEETTFDAGTVDRGADIKHSFKLKNVGKAPLNSKAKPG